MVSGLLVERVRREWPRSSRRAADGRSTRKANPLPPLPDPASRIREGRSNRKAVLLFHIFRSFTKREKRTKKEKKLRRPLEVDQFNFSRWDNVQVAKGAKGFFVFNPIEPLRPWRLRVSELKLQVSYRNRDIEADLSPLSSENVIDALLRSPCVPI
jgi:hypothetical protein